MAALALPDELLRDPRLFRGGQRLDARRDGVPSGQHALDAALPWGGFPRGALSELLHGHDGIGEFGLLLPALRQLCAEAPIALIRPPYIPYAPALALAGLPLERLIWIDPPPERGLWAAEQCLRAGCLSAVLAWDGGADVRPLRRLQVAADSGRALAFLFRPERHLANPSPAALRLRIAAGELEVVKCRGAGMQGAEMAQQPISFRRARPGRGLAASPAATPTGASADPRLHQDDQAKPAEAVQQIAQPTRANPATRPHASGRPGLPARISQPSLSLVASPLTA